MNLGAAVGLVSLAINNLKVIENEEKNYMGSIVRPHSRAIME